MSEREKPLHVRVAGVIGCKPEWRDLWGGDWFCGCEDLQHDDSMSCLAEFDVDWSATGPLIEKYGIDLVMLWPGDAGNDGFCWLATSAAEQRSPDPQAVGSVEGPTPLIAVCNLILALKEAGKL